ncbi:hypothetical protein BDW02DRAFT_493181 [Decorospora gaudefroyi]|uniref:Zn(2)-C6 fungal-type domain-containing protein n=1 Tax=Decorospora gaudefroyi TaxID=184978 RepID=A0A6A5KKG1_9PLEO|nr:hypothetical protein BDW02DRAFT_493181 [Decorospora gaudefroyi]
MSHNHHDNLPNESLQNLLSLDDELYDPFFQGELRYPGAHDGSCSGSYELSEQPYLVSATPSVADGPPSLDYTVSAPPSFLEESSSFGQACETSLSFDTIATSPLAGQDEGQYVGSLGACDSALLSPLGQINESPILDTRYERIPNTFASSTGSFESTTETIFNPHITGSSHHFSGLDVRASQAFSNVGTWADQPRVVENDGSRAEVAPIDIPQSLPPSYNSVPSNYRQFYGSHEQHTRAITITEGARTHGPRSYNSRLASSPSTQRVPLMLSISPITSRHPRSAALSRSTSRSQRKVVTPSPTSESYGWVSYQPNPATNKLAPTSTEGLPGRAPRGRKRGLTAEQRSHAALMRIVGACSNCQRRKEKCDPGTPCRACLEYYKGELVNHPCRDHVLSDLSAVFLSDHLGWHPTARSLESFVDPSKFSVSTGITYTVPLCFGFGPKFPVSVHALQLIDHEPLVHEHIIYSWPPEPVSGPPHKDAVLPAVLTDDAKSKLVQTLDSHLSQLVTHHFRSFPLYCSPLRILREVYIFSRSVPTSSPHCRTLHQALKLLVLVHIGGDITLPSRSESLILDQLVRNTMDLPDGLDPKPCFIRSQFGAIMPGLALMLMKEVLSSLEQLLLNKDCDEWPIALAVLITILMTVESIHYHATKLPYHNQYDTARSANTEKDFSVDDQGVRELLVFYSACFSGCHARLRPDWEGESTRSCAHNDVRPEDIFIESLREAIRKASGAGYLAKKASEKRGHGDMGYFFDRLVARLVLLRP